MRIFHKTCYDIQIDGLEQDCCDSSALAMELLQCCAKPSTYTSTILDRWIKLALRAIHIPYDYWCHSTQMTSCGLIHLLIFFCFFSAFSEIALRTVLQYPILTCMDCVGPWAQPQTSKTSHERRTGLYNARPASCGIRTIRWNCNIFMVPEFVWLVESAWSISTTCHVQGTVSLMFKVIVCCLFCAGLLQSLIQF